MGRDTRSHGVGVSDLVTHVQKTGGGEGQTLRNGGVQATVAWGTHLWGQKETHTGSGGVTPATGCEGRHPPWGMGMERPLCTQEKLDTRPGIQSQGETRALQEMDTQRGERDAHQEWRRVAAAPIGRGRQAVEKGVGTGHTCPYTACTRGGGVGRGVRTP